MDMQSRVRDNVPAITGLLSLVSLALVLAAARQLVPQTLLPAAPAAVVAAIPHVNAAISLVALATIGLGVRAIRRGDVVAHRRLMGTSFALFLTFLVLYLYKVALKGPRGFPESAPALVETYVYLPILGIHMLLAIVCLPLLYYVLLLAYTHPIHELPQTRHPTVGKVAAGLWSISFFLGFVVYLMLYVLF